MLPQSRWTVYVCTFLIAFSVLLLEIALIRIFSVLTWHHFTFMIISVAVLGFGGAESYLALEAQKKPREGESEDEPAATNATRLARSALAFSFASLVCLVVVSRLELEPLNIGSDWLEGVKLIVCEGVLAVPFFFAGICLATIISTHHEDIHRIYFADLLGASFGALASVVCIRYLGATNTLFLTALLGGLTALLLSGNADAGVRRESWIGVAGLGMLLLYGVIADPYLVHGAPSKPISLYVSPELGTDWLDYSEWHTVARVDVTKSGRSQVPPMGGNLAERYRHIEWEQRMVFQDGAAPTWILGSDGNVEEMGFLKGYLQAMPYSIKQDPKTLVIGVGGGGDILIALHHGASHVTGVEINPMMARTILDEYADFSGQIFHRDDVEIVVAEGRHFLSKKGETFDVIQLSGVDTLTALSSGAYAMAENYLYTVESIDDALNRLKSDGVLSYSRWLFEPPRETLRLTTTMLEALRRRGIENPSRHLVIVKGEWWPEPGKRESWANTIVKKTPFTEAELAKIRRWAAGNQFSLVYDPFVAGDNEFDAVLRADQAGREAFYSSYRYELSPSTDNRPFFFNYHKWSNVFTAGKRQGTDFPMAFLTLAWSLGLILFLAILGILLPARKQSDGPADYPGALVYFCALGLGFMFVEISLIQKLMVFLGGPTYSLALTIFAILFFSGLGSRFARRFEFRVERLLAVLALVVPILIISVNFVFDMMIPRWLALEWAQRAVLAVMVIAPLAFVLGIPFPSGLRAVGQHSEEWVPWAWAANSFMTVLGPLLCIFLSMLVGFRVVMVAAACIYVAGFVTMRPLVAAWARKADQFDPPVAPVGSVARVASS